jgi:hypothetical protein
VLDVDAGIGWLSYRLPKRGHRPLAVDLLDNDSDGFGAARHYFTPRNFENEAPVLATDLCE